MAALAEPVTILALGDSLTAGYGLPQDEGLVPTLERWLTEAGEDVVLVNAGVSGDTTAGGLSRLDWSLTDEVDAVIVALGGNDLLRGLPPEAARRNLDQILDIVDRRGLPAMLVGLEAPGNYGPDYKASFDAIYPDLAYEHDALLFPNFFAGIAEGNRMDETIRRFMQPDGIHPNAEGVEKIVAVMGPTVRDLIDEAEE